MTRHQNVDYKTITDRFRTVTPLVLLIVKPVYESSIFQLTTTAM